MTLNGCASKRGWLVLVFSIPLFATTCCSVTAADFDIQKYFRKLNHYIVNETQAAYEINENSQAFLDWTLVNPGFIEYVGRTDGEIVPLSDDHPFTDPDQIEAVPVCVPSGIQIRVMPARKGPSFAELIDPVYPWEKGKLEANTLLYDESDKLYKVWYETAGGIAYAESPDLKSWKKPLKTLTAFEDQKETNLAGFIHIEEAVAGRLKAATEARLGSGGSFFIDPSAPPEERYKTIFLAHTKHPHYNDNGPLVDHPVSAMTGPTSTVLFGAVSSDGMAWRILPDPLCYHDADTQTVIRYDTLKKKYVGYTRLYEHSRRSIAYFETDHFGQWPLPINILTAGPEDPPTVDFYANAFSFYPGNPYLRMIFCLLYDRFTDSGSIRLATSRDGRTFHFTPGEAVIPRGPAGTVESGFLAVRPGLIRMPDGQLAVLYTGWKMPHKFPRKHLDKIPESSNQFLATWPEDRMAAIDSSGKGEFSTAHLEMKSDKLFLNYAARRTGYIKVEVRDKDFQPVPGKTFEDCDPLSGDQIYQQVKWKGNGDLGVVKGQRIYLRFKMKDACLFSMRGGK